MTTLGDARRSFAWRRILRVEIVLTASIVVLLGLLVLAPLATILFATMAEDGLAVWREVLTGRLSRNLFWLPLINTLTIGVLVGVFTTLIGGFLAWLVVLTDVPARRIIGALASLPFVLPGFAIALAWVTVFRNGRIGGQVGVLGELGIMVPDWLAWGAVPIVIVLVAHYYSLCFMLIAAGLASVNADLLEAGEVAGANRLRILAGITLPIVLPSLVAATLLAFAQGASNFAVPALLGLPVRYQTLSTRLFGMIQTGQVERGYVLAVLLIVVAGVLLWAGNRLVAGRRSYATITGKGGRRTRTPLGRWRWPLFAIAAVICIGTTIVPMLVLLASSFASQRGSLLSGYTTHFWIGTSTPEFAQGQAGILRDPQFLSGVTTTIGLGLAVALAATVLGLIIGYVVSRVSHPLVDVVKQLAFLPLLVPGIAFGAAYIALFGSSLGPIPALYGTFTILVLAGTAYTLPFAAQSGQAAMAQVSKDLEESAIMARAGFMRRLFAVLLPLTVRGLSAGAVLVFVKIVRDLSLVVLLFTPSTPLLSVFAFRYASEGYLQFANAITVVIASISILATLVAHRIQRRAQPWLQDG